MEKIRTIHKLAEVLNNDAPIGPGGHRQQDYYTQAIRLGGLNKKLFTDLSVSAIAHILILFPKYPQAINFVQWVQKTDLDNTFFYNTLVDFLKNVWTEKRYPGRMSERFSILRQIVPKADISLPWICETSKVAGLQEPWIGHDIAYFYDKEHALRSLVYLAGVDTNFVDNFIIRIPYYLNDFTGEEIGRIFESWGSVINDEQRAELDKWLNLFAAEGYKMM